MRVPVATRAPLNHTAGLASSVGGHFQLLRQAYRASRHRHRLRLTYACLRNRKGKVDKEALIQVFREFDMDKELQVPTPHPQQLSRHNHLVRTMQWHTRSSARRRIPV